jgi:hypothetical protein
LAEGRAAGVTSVLGSISKALGTAFANALADDMVFLAGASDATLTSATAEALTQDVTFLAGGLALTVTTAQAEAVAVQQTVTLGDISYTLDASLGEGIGGDPTVSIDIGLIQIGEAVAWGENQDLILTLGSIAASLATATAESLAFGPDIALGTITYPAGFGEAWGYGFGMSGTILEFPCYPTEVVYRLVGESVVERTVEVAILYAAEEVIEVPATKVGISFIFREDEVSAAELAGDTIRVSEVYREIHTELAELVTPEKVSIVYREADTKIVVSAVSQTTIQKGTPEAEVTKNCRKGDGE